MYEKNEYLDVDEIIDFAIENGASDVDFEEKIPKTNSQNAAPYGLLENKTLSRGL